MKIEWNDEYETGEAVVDSDHKHLFELFNGFVDIIEKNNADAQIEKYIKDLEDYANTHFDREEATLQKLPELAYKKHTAEHDEFGRIIQNIYNEIYSEGDISSLYQIVLFLSEWLLNHVRYSDKQHLLNKS